MRMLVGQGKVGISWMLTSGPLETEFCPHTVFLSKLK